MGCKEDAAIRVYFFDNGLEPPMAYYKAFMSDVGHGGRTRLALAIPDFLGGIKPNVTSSFQLCFCSVTEAGSRRRGLSNTIQHQDAGEFQSGIFR